MKDKTEHRTLSILLDRRVLDTSHQEYREQKCFRQSD